MSDKIGLHTEPSLHLRTKGELEAALATEPWKGQPHPFKYLVRAEYVIETIHELAAAKASPWDTVYNAEIKQAVRAKLGLPPLSDRDNATEGDALSLLIYNAQEWRRKDMLRAAGFVVGSEDLLADAYREKFVVELPSGTLLDVREKGGRYYAMRPRKRNQHYPIDGQEVRFISARQAKLLRAEEAELLKRPVLVIKLGGGHPADLSRFRPAAATYAAAEEKGA